MKPRTARTLDQTPGASYKLLQRLQRRRIDDLNAKLEKNAKNARRERLNLNECRTTRQHLRRWLFNAFGI